MTHATTRVGWRRRVAADAALLAVAVVWGATFPVAKHILGWVPPFLYLALRFGLAAAVLLPFTTRGFRAFPARAWPRALAVGTALAGGYALQTLGLRTAGATVAAFLTGLSVVLVPAIGVLVGRRPTGVEWAGVAAATAGLALLTLQGTTRPGLGELLLLGCAVCFALHILWLDRAAALAAPLPLGAVQVATVGFLCALIVPLEPAPRPAPTLVWIAVAAMGLTASAAAFTIQAWAQRFTPPTHVGLVFAAEPVAAAVLAWGWLGESLSGRQWLGAALILAGILLAQGRPRRQAPAGVRSDAPP